jgi:hypothetical protein
MGGCGDFIVALSAGERYDSAEERDEYQATSA